MEIMGDFYQDKYGKSWITTPSYIPEDLGRLVPDRKAKLCGRNNFHHKQVWRPVKTIQTQRGRPLTFCMSDGCEVCDNMPQWVERVQKWLDSEDWKEGEDVASDYVKHHNSSEAASVKIAKEMDNIERAPRPVNPQFLVEYLLQECQFRGAAFPWKHQWALDWLNGVRADPPRTNFEVATDGEDKVECYKALMGYVASKKERDE